MEIVEKIHSEFKLALRSAHIVTKDVKEIELVNNSMQRLRSLGLDNSQTYKKFENEYSSKEGQLSLNKLAEELLAIETKFPQYRLIGFNKTIEICEKYNLFTSLLSNYTGVVPNKNLKEIEEHKKAVENKSVCAGSYYNSQSLFESLLNGAAISASSPTYFIAAPKKDFKKDLTQVGRMLINVERSKFDIKFGLDLSAPDPVVLCPVKISGGSIVFQIVTAWGPEADDDYISKFVKIEVNNN